MTIVMMDVRINKSKFMYQAFIVISLLYLVAITSSVNGATTRTTSRCRNESTTITVNVTEEEWCGIGVYCALWGSCYCDVTREVNKTHITRICEDLKIGTSSVNGATTRTTSLCHNESTTIRVNITEEVWCEGFSVYCAIWGSCYCNVTREVYKTSITTICEDAGTINTLPPYEYGQATSESDGTSKNPTTSTPTTPTPTTPTPTTTNPTSTRGFNNSLFFEIIPGFMLIPYYNFSEFQTNDERVIISYTLYYRPAEEGEAVTYYKSRLCDSDTLWYTHEIPKTHVSQEVFNGVTYYSSYLLGMSPSTRYAFYVQTFTTEAIGLDGARSPIIYYTTQAYKPRKPRYHKVSQVSSKLRQLMNVQSKL